MALQFIHDKKGNTTGVYIPIEEWESLTSKYVELQKAESEQSLELADWQKQVIDQRLSSYESDPKDVLDFDQTLDDIENGL
jgi:hypothetical protein